LLQNSTSEFQSEVPAQRAGLAGHLPAKGERFNGGGSVQDMDKKEAMTAGIIACEWVKEAGMEEFIRLSKHI